MRKVGHSGQSYLRYSRIAFCEGGSPHGSTRALGPKECIMEHKQTFPIAPVTLASVGRVLQAFPIGWPFLGLIALLAVALVVGIAVEMTQAPAAALAGLAALLVLLLPFLWVAVASRRVAVALS